jgi:hypothetical protein
VLINLIFFCAIALLVLAFIFLIQKQRLTRSAQPPLTRPKMNLHRKSKPSSVIDGVPESAIKAVVVYTHDRAAAARLLQSYHRAHGSKGWDAIAGQVIRDLVHDRR